MTRSVTRTGAAALAVFAALASCAAPPTKDGGAKSPPASVELVELYAGWNRACKMQEQVTSELAKEYEGRVTVKRVDVEADADAPGRYGVESKPPTVVIVVDGKPTKKLSGLRSAEELRKVLDEALGGGSE